MKLPWKIVLHHKLYWVLAVVAALSVIFPGSLETISGNMSEEAYREQRDLYGSFQFIAYMDGSNLKNNWFEADYVAELFPDKQMKIPGYIYKLGLAEIDGFTVDFGYLDDEAWRLSGGKMIKGKLPDSIGQIALSDTKVSELSSAVEYDVGNEVEVNGRMFTISGIYEEFGTRWVGSNSFRLYTEVDGIFSKEETEYIWNSSNIRLLTILMDERELFSNEEMQDVKNIFKNIYLTEEYATYMYQLPEFVIPTVFVMSLLLMGSIVMLIEKQRTAVNKIYLQLGLSQGRLMVIQVISFLICYAFWIVCRDTCIRDKKYKIWISERLCDVFVCGSGNMSAGWERKMETVLLEKGQVKSILHRCVCLVRIYLRFYLFLYTGYDVGISYDVHLSV